MKQMRQTKRGRNNNNNKKRPDWTSLPDELLEMIVERVAAVTDCLSFSKVCKAWRNAVADAPSTHNQSRGFPWLLMSGETHSKTRTCFSILEKKVFHIEMPKAYGKYLLGSFRNWLIMAEWSDAPIIIQLSLLSPFSGTEVILPKSGDLYHKLVLSGGCPFKKSCIYMLLHAIYGELALWVPGSQKWLRCILSHNERIKDATFFNGYFYLLVKDRNRDCNMDCNIRIIDPACIYSLIKREWSACIPLRSEELYQDSKTGLKNEFYQVEMPVGGSILKDERTLVRDRLLESCGEILLVRRYFKDAGDSAFTNYAFKVYRLDFCRMAWVYLDDLGDRILFFGKNCSFSSSAKELGVGKGNCICFTNERADLFLNDFSYPLDVVSGIDDWDMYDLSTDGRGDFSFILRGNNKWQPFWISAPLWWHCQKNIPFLNCVADLKLAREVGSQEKKLIEKETA